MTLVKDFKYRIQVFFSEEDEGYIATVPELPGCSAFGESPEKAVREVKIAAAGWIRAAKSMDRELPKPISEKKYPGKFLLRIPPELQKELDMEAKIAGLSLNQFLLYKLARDRNITIAKKRAAG